MAAMGHSSILLLINIALVCLLLPHEIQGESPPIECPRACTKEYNPVCSNTGKTYGNKCTFQEAKDCRDPSLKICYYGQCECDKDQDKQQVCGSDGATYDSKCSYRHHKKCHKPYHLSVEGYGPCFIIHRSTSIAAQAPPKTALLLTSFLIYYRLFTL